MAVSSESRISRVYERFGELIDSLTFCVFIHQFLWHNIGKRQLTRGVMVNKSWQCSVASRRSKSAKDMDSVMTDARPSDVMDVSRDDRSLNTSEPMHIPNGSRTPTRWRDYCRGKNSPYYYVHLNLHAIEEYHHYDFAQSLHRLEDLAFGYPRHLIS